MGTANTSEQHWEDFLSNNDLERRQVVRYYAHKTAGKWDAQRIVEEIFQDLIAIGALQLPSSWDPQRFHAEVHPGFSGSELQLVAVPEPWDVRRTKVLANPDSWGGPRTLLGEFNVLRIVRQTLEAAQRITAMGPPGNPTPKR